jgi:4-carboxymuconolactone decarboxylase
MNKDCRINPVNLPLSGKLTSAMSRLIPKSMKPPRLFLSIARNEDLFVELVENNLISSNGLLYSKRISDFLREIIVLRTCIACKNEYEFNLHVRTISRRMGLTDSQLVDIRSNNPSLKYWRQEVLVLFDFIDELVSSNDLSDSTYACSREYFSEEQLIEITFLIGLYNSVAMLVNLIRPANDDY